MVWGFSVIADSAQFSAALSHAADSRYVGTALTAQMAIGFIITVATIRLVPFIAHQTGWRWALTGLALGPVSGALAMRGAARGGDARRLARNLNRGEATFAGETPHPSVRAPDTPVG